MNFQKLIALIDLPDNDYGYDLACAEARDIVDLHCEEVLNAARAEWRSWTALRQEHLAYILGEGNSTVEAEWVIDMTSSDHSGVRSRAMEALQCLVREVEKM
jgi:hypothetical protein